MNLFSSFIWILTAFIPASRGITVTQPEVVNVSEGQIATIDCKTDTGIDSWGLAWYQQKHGEAPKLIIYRLFFIQTESKPPIRRMMIISVCIWTLILSVQEITGQVSVTQTPSEAAVQGGTVSINCQTNRGIGDRSAGCGSCLSWYLQKP
ncbi:hypothetical protein PO909_017534, partial [Leuciscus waleckii]